MIKKLNCEILVDITLELKEPQNTDKVVEEIHKHINQLVEGTFVHFKGLEINGDYNLTFTEDKEKKNDRWKDAIEV